MIAIVLHHRLVMIILCLTPSIIHSYEESENLSVNTGESASFVCDLPERLSNKRADFYGPTGRLLVASNGEDPTRFLVEHTYAWTWTLIMSDVSDDDVGEYTCRVSSSLNIDSDQTATNTIIKRFNLTVLTPPKILDITIESSNSGSTGLLLENDQIILKCLARGVPHPIIIWRIPGRRYLSNSNRNNRNIILHEDKLIIRNLSRTTPIDYQCIADNGIPPRDTRTRRLLPAIAPEMTIQSSRRSQSQLILNCTIIARPLTTAKWKRNRIEIGETQREQINDYQINLIVILQIDSWNSTNLFGMYECEAENQLKVTKAFIMIDEFSLSNITTTKKQPMSLPSSYAQIELLLNRASPLSSHTYLLWIIFVSYATGFYNKR